MIGGIGWANRRSRSIRRIWNSRVVGMIGKADSRRSQCSSGYRGWGIGL